MHTPYLSIAHFKEKGMKKTINWLLSSFDNHTTGASARKLSAFALMVCVAYCHIRFVDATNVTSVLVIDLSAMLLCLGIVTAEQVIRLKNGNENPPTPPENTE